MRLRYYVIVLFTLCFLYWACDNSEDGLTANESPSIPELLSPVNFALIDSPGVTFLWNPAIDPEGESITYNLQLSTRADFTNILFSDLLHDPSIEMTLEKGVFYYWRVRAIDASNNTSDFSERQNLVISDESIVNYPPFAPELRFPALNDEVDVNQVRLGWIGFDIDDSDLLYNIYIGTEFGNLTLYAEAIEEMEVTLNLDPAEVYYWRVEVSDALGQLSSSPVWWFKSE